MATEQKLHGAELEAYKARLTGICKTSLWRYTQKGLTIEEACELRGVVYSRTR